ncbi:Uncharacterised protein [Mycoplasmopsis columboralis]|uniref:Uncharacterized protein n=1 Tax=Mycoplasmopsis columboralis TaxID=171282 RepID=A0A449B6L9_9BACT|nr:hypothetical protein [Mycoplasmopsis columboralis]VEU76244.1 Uncharacterised protein [Mycoplasmopsis columboralis]
MIFQKIGIQLLISFLYGENAYENGVLQVNRVYYLIFLIALLSFAFLAIFGLTKHYLKGKDVDKKVSQTARKILPVLGSFILYPLFAFFVMFFLSLLQELLQIAFFGTNAQNGFDFAKNTFVSLKPSDISEETWNTIAQNNYRYSFPVSEQPSIVVVIIVAVVGCMMLFQVISIASSLVSQIMSASALFFIYPLVNVFRLYDEDAVYNKWKVMFYSKLTTIVSYMLALNIFILFIGFMNRVDIFTEDSLILGGALKIILLLGSLGGIELLIGDISDLFGQRQSVKSGFRIAKDMFRTGIQVASSAGTAVGLAHGAVGGLAKGATALKAGAFGVDVGKGILKANLQSGNISKLQYKQQLAQHKANIKENNIPSHQYKVRGGLIGKGEDYLRSQQYAWNEHKIARAEKQFAKNKITEDQKNSIITKAQSKMNEIDARDKAKYELKNNYKSSLQNKGK